MIHRLNHYQKTYLQDCLCNFIHPFCVFRFQNFPWTPRLTPSVTLCFNSVSTILSYSLHNDKRYDEYTTHITIYIPHTCALPRLELWSITVRASRAIIPSNLRVWIYMSLLLIQKEPTHTHKLYLHTCCLGCSDFPEVLCDETQSFCSGH